MNLYTLGVNHETAPVDIRETVSFTAERILFALQELKDKNLVSESIILSTCNRSEIYFSVKDAQSEPVVKWVHEFFELTDGSLQPYIYLYQDVEAVKHIMRVACGLNSLVLGEPQILGQLKDAYNLAHKTESVHHLLEMLFQNVFRTAKQVRTDTSIGSSPVSVAFAAVSLAKQFFSDLSEQTVLLLGAGETIELVGRHLQENKVGRMIIANRTFDRAHTLAENLGGYAIELDDLTTHLHEADIVIASTGSPTTLLHKSDVQAALKKRRNRPMFMVDIAVPRDIDVGVNELEDVYLYSVDDLQEIISQNRQSRQEAANEAEDIIQMQAEHFICQYQAIKSVNPLIRAYRSNAELDKERLLQKAQHRLAIGHDPKKVLALFAHQLANKLMHTPSHQLYEAGITGNQTLIDTAEMLLIGPERNTN